MRTKQLSSSDDAFSASATETKPDPTDLELCSASSSGFDVPRFDIAEKCPVLTSAASAVGKECFTAGEIDMLQHDLEKVLFQGVMRCLKFKHGIVDVDRGYPSRNEKRSASSKFHVASSSKSHTKVSEPNAIGKRTGNQAASTTTGLKIRPPKKTDHVTISERNAISPGSSRHHLWPQNQIPVKFLDFVNLFAGPIFHEDILILRNLIDNIASTSVTRITSNIMAKKTASVKKLIDLQNGSSFNKSKTAKIPPKKVGRRCKRPRLDSNVSINVNTSSTNNTASCKLGNLTEHLIQAMIVENELSFEESDCKVENGDIVVQNASIKSFVRSLNMGNLSALEKLVRQELEDQGILDEDGLMCTGNETTQGDEVSEELRLRRKEFSLVQHSNLRQLSLLMKKSEKTAARNELIDNLNQADDELRDLCAKYYGLVPMPKRSLSKKEKDLLWKVFKNREECARKLDAFDS